MLVPVSCNESCREITTLSHFKSPLFSHTFDTILSRNCANGEELTTSVLLPKREKARTSGISPLSVPFPKSRAFPRRKTLLDRCLDYLASREPAFRVRRFVFHPKLCGSRWVFAEMAKNGGVILLSAMVIRRGLCWSVIKQRQADLDFDGMRRPLPARKGCLG